MTAALPCEHRMPLSCALERGARVTCTDAHCPQWTQKLGLPLWVSGRRGTVQEAPQRGLGAMGPARAAWAWGCAGVPSSR